MADTCLEVRFTPNYIWTCQCPREDHPLAYGGTLSHCMLTTCAWPRP